MSGGLLELLLLLQLHHGSAAVNVGLEQWSHQHGSCQVSFKHHIKQVFDRLDQVSEDLLGCGLCWGQKDAG